MATQTTYELQAYYAGLLINQYLQQPNAYATIEATTTPILIPQVSTQSIIFSLVPTSGAFVLSYNGNATSSIAWNASAATIQTDLRLLSGLGSVTVTGSIASLSLIVTFIGVTPPAIPLLATTNTLLASTAAVGIVITETDLTIPLAVQNAFNFIQGSPIAVGAQLDVIGKYAGVSRTAQGFTADITLNDADFTNLILLAIFQNSNGSSLYDIQLFINNFVAGGLLVFDNKNMTMTYYVSTTFASENLLQVLIKEGLLPQPMTVYLYIIYAPIINAFFSFRTYTQATVNGSPFNSYLSYDQMWPWLDYTDSIQP